MSKTTKALAILGVVAGLGVAALPLSSYAAPVEWKDSCTDASDPTCGTKDDKHYVGADATVKLTITDKLSIESSATSDITLAAPSSTATAGVYTHTDPLTITVITKNSKGYDLTMVGSQTGAATAMTHDSDSTVNIPGTGFDTSSSATTSSWGYQLAANAATTAADAGISVTATNTYLAIPSSAASIMSRAAATSDTGDKVDVKFGANIVSSQAAGTYTGKVTFTASDKVARTAE